MADIKRFSTFINVMLIITIIDGVVTGYFFHEGEHELMFAPLIVGFVLVSILYYFIEKRSEAEAGKPVDKY